MVASLKTKDAFTAVHKCCWAISVVKRCRNEVENMKIHDCHPFRPPTVVIQGLQYSSRIQMTLCGAKLEFVSLSRHNYEGPATTQYVIMPSSCAPCLFRHINLRSPLEALLKWRYSLSFFAKKRIAFDGHVA